MTVPTIAEPAREIPVVAEADVCVCGGSCTGLFAAVRAARLGARVVLVEQSNAFGGTATNGLVNIWHSVYDTTFERRIIGGLTAEVVERLLRRDACILREPNANSGCILNPEELKLELDELVREHGIRPFLHTRCVAPHLVDGRVDAVCVENQDGRGAIRTRVVVDATGDGDLAAQLGLPHAVAPEPQAPTTCAKLRGLGGLDVSALYNAHRHEYDLPEDSGWSCEIPGAPDVRMHADTHVYGVDCSRADQLTHAELEGRRRIRALMDMVRRYEPQRASGLCLLDLAATIGVRETRRFTAAYTLREKDVLHGRRFPDAIANGSYRVDIHHPAGGGYLFKYLDGSQVSITARGREHGRWREPVAENPTFYQIPYRCLVHPDAPNLILAGRMLAADRGAFGAVRVMVNLNQVGEAAGVAAHLAASGDLPVTAVDPAGLRSELTAGGSIII